MPAPAPVEERRLEDHVGAARIASTVSSWARKLRGRLRDAAGHLDDRSCLRPRAARCSDARDRTRGAGSGPVLRSSRNGFSISPLARSRLERDEVVALEEADEIRGADDQRPVDQLHGRPAVRSVSRSPVTCRGQGDRTVRQGRGSIGPWWGPCRPAVPASPREAQSIARFAEQVGRRVRPAPAEGRPCRVVDERLGGRRPGTRLPDAEGASFALPWIETDEVRAAIARRGAILGPGRAVFENRSPRRRACATTSRRRRECRSPSNHRGPSSPWPSPAAISLGLAASSGALPAGRRSASTDTAKAFPRCRRSRRRRGHDGGVEAVANNVISRRSCGR